MKTIYAMMILRYFVMSQVLALKEKLKPGQVYRRGDLAQWSNAVDRHLKLLQDDGTLTKLSGGLYYYPKQTAFGQAPADDETLVHAFLKDNRFLITSPNLYNTLGLGLTQLYNETVVYNHKRHGRFKLGKREFDFRMKPYFPASLSDEFLLVDVVNNLSQLADDPQGVLERVQDKAKELEQNEILALARNFGTVRSKKFFADVFSAPLVSYA
jgi:hypothetical protein